MITTLEKLFILRRKLDRITIDEHDRGLQFFNGNEVALMKRLIDEYITEAAEEILLEE